MKTAVLLSKRTVLALLLGICLLASELFIISSGYSEMSAGHGWLDGWQYRKIQTIYAAEGAGVNYSVRTKINFNESIAPPQQSNILVDDGCWCWFQDPRAVCYKGKTYFTWTSSNGSNGISCYDNSTRMVEHFTLRYNFDKDDHSCPSILVRADGRIIAFYTQHSTNLMRWRISNSPEDISSWSSEYSFVGAKSSLCYSQPVRLSEENDTIYLFYRSLPSSGPGFWVYRKSHDGGQTFGNEVDLLTFTRWSPYTKVVSNGRDKIYLAFGDDNGSATPHRDIMFCYYFNGAFYRANGTLVKSESQLPINDKRTVDMIYNSSTLGNHDAWIWDIALNASGVPHLVFSELISNDDHRYRYALWTGSQWVNNEICHAGAYIDGPVEGYYSGGLCLDHNDPRNVYLSRQAESGQFEIYNYSTTDRGTSWSSTPITSNSTYKNCRPTFVANSHGSFKIIWWSGTYTFYTDYRTSLLGYSVEVVGTREEVEVSCEGNCRPDFGDVRFTRSDGTSELDYWIEESVEGSRATFWVKILDDLEVGDATIYIYYGKSDAVTTSNGENTFPFFDDFLATSLNRTKWSIRQGDFSISGSSLELTGTIGTRGLLESQMEFSANSAIHSRTRLSNASSNVHHFCSTRQSGSWDNRAGDVWTTGTNQVAFETGEAGIPTITYITLNSIVDYHSYQTAWEAGESRFYQDYDLAATTTTNVPTMDMVVVFYEGQTLGTTCYVDWIFVSKWVDPEPGQGVWGNQEQVSKPVLSLRPATVSCRRLGETLTVEIGAANIDSVSNFTFAISFNTTLLDYDSTMLLSLEHGTATANEEYGVVAGSAATSTPISGNCSLVRVVFRAAYSHIWRNEKTISGWKNNQIGTVKLQAATLEVQSGPVFHYEEGVIDEIEVPSGASYVWSPIKGDLNNDGCVDVFDICSLVMYFSTSGDNPLWTAASRYDLTNNDLKVIDVWDLLIVSTNYGFEYAGLN